MRPEHIKTELPSVLCYRRVESSPVVAIAVQAAQPALAASTAEPGAGPILFAKHLEKTNREERADLSASAVPPVRIRECRAPRASLFHPAPSRFATARQLISYGTAPQPGRVINTHA